jgi:hypothetical protein
MNELIKSFHQMGIIPVLNRDAHQGFLEDSIPGYSAEGFAALERFAESNGFRVVQRDYNFRFAFYPGSVPSAYSDWPSQDVPVGGRTP